MEDFIIIAILAVIVALAIGYIIRAKKSGKNCIGCSGGCSSKSCNKSSCCCCNEKADKE